MKTIINSNRVLPLYELAKPILETLPEYDAEKPDPGVINGAIELKHINFRYNPDGPLILKDVSLTIQEGEYVGIVGSSDSGKSTLLRILLGFEKPEDGQVYYDGKDLSTIDVKALRRQFGVVLQNAHVMAGSIFNNIVGSNYQLTLKDAEEAYLKRPDLRRMKQAIAVAEYQVVQAKAGLLPQVSLSYNYQLDGKDKFFADDSKRWALTFNFSGLAFDGFATKNRIAAAQENLKLLQHQEDTQRDQVMVEVIQTIRNLKETKYLIDTNRLNIDLARENVNLTELQFNIGKATTSDFKDAQMSLLQALDGYHGQVINYLIQQARFDYVTGTDLSD
jgi:ABC-type histidine transport system ATPase subunit